MPGEDLGHGIGKLVVVVLVGHFVALGLLLHAGALNVALNLLADSHLTGALADLGKIGTSELVRLGGQVLQIDVLGHGRLAQGGAEDAQTTLEVGHGDVNELVEAAGTHEGRVDDVGPVGGTDDEDVLLGADAVHLSEELVHDAIGGAAAIARAATALLGDGIELIEEEDAGSGLAGLLEDVADVGLGLAEPHGEELGSLDRDEVGLALVGDGLGHEGLTATGRAVEQHTLGGAHAELLELFGVLDGILDELLEVALDTLETTNVVPGDVGDLHDGLAEAAGVGNAQSVAEVVLADGHRIEDLGVDLLVLDVDEVHLLADALHGGLGTEGGDIGADEAVGLAGDGLRVDVLVELHVAGVDAEHLEAAVLVGDANVDLAVEAAEAAEGGVDGVGAVGGADDDDGGALLEAVHEGEKLGDDAALDLAVGLVALGGDGVDLVDEDDGGGVLLGLLEGLAEVGLGLSGHLGHDLGSVDEEEEGAGLVGDGPGDEGLAGAGGSVQEDAAGGLDAKGLEEGGVAKGELDHLADLSHLLAAAADVVVPDVVGLLLILALDGLALAVDDGVGRDDAVGGGVGLNDLELDGMHGGPDEEQVALLHGTVGLEEVGLEVDVEEVAGDALDGIVDGEDVDALAVRDVAARRDGDDVGQADAEVLPHDLVHLDGRVVAGLLGQDDADGVPALLALDEDGVAAEELELLHLGGAELDDGVVVVGRVVDDEAVRAALLAGGGAEDGLLHVGVRLAANRIE